MITRLVIEKLFGRFNYIVELDRNNITIITGPNGFGKTTILKIISALSAADIRYFYKLEFSEIIFYFNNGDSFSIQQSFSRRHKELAINGKTLLTPIITRAMALGVPWLRRTSPRKWFDLRSREYFDQEELAFHIFDGIDEDMDYFKDVLGFNDEQLKKYKYTFEAMKLASKKCGNVRLITEQRLISKEFDEDNKVHVIDVINELPNKIKEKINKITANYSRKANALDSTYPQRLLSTKVGLSGVEEFDKKMRDAQKKFSRLSNYDLTYLPMINAEQYSAEFSKALKIYFDDFNEKYAVFEKFIDKLDLYTDIVNERLNFKKIYITREDGIVVKDDNGKTIELDLLSSGEKQEIVLFYELIFETDGQLLLMIDEPEISLHIVWQRMFMRDLEKVAELGNLKVIVATHSPQIINNRWDLQIDLGELYGC